MASKGYQVNVAQMERDAEMKNARAFRNSIRGKFIFFNGLYHLIPLTAWSCLMVK